MNSRKTIVFIINNKKQVFTEFNENTQVGFLKTYVRDITKFDKFNLLYGGNVLKNDLLKIKKLCADARSSKMIFHVHDLRTFVDNTETQKLRNEITNIKKENKSLKERNESLVKEKNFYQMKENHYKVLYEKNLKAQEDQKLLIENFQKLVLEKKKIEELYNASLEKINELESEIRNKSVFSDTSTKHPLKSDDERGVETTVENVIVNTDYDLKDSKTPSTRGDLRKPSPNEISDNQKKNDNLNIKTISKKLDQKPRPSLNTPKKDMAEQTKILKNMTLKNDSANNSGKDKDKKLMMSRSACELKTKKYILDCISPNISPKDINMDVMKQGFNYKLKIIKKSLDKESPWTFIIPYLTKADQVSLSLSSKKLGVNVLKYWKDYTCTKSNHIRRRKHYGTVVYQNSYKGQTFQISHFSNSALKILNKPQHLATFQNEKYIEYFNNEMLLPVYRILFQFAVPGESIDNNVKFIEYFVGQIRENTKKRGVGDYLRVLLNSFDFSTENVEKVGMILKKNNMTSLNNSAISAKCKTTGIISFIIKDALIFSGFEKEAKSTNESIKLRNDIIEETHKISELDNTYSELQRKIDKIILKYSE